MLKVAICDDEPYFTDSLEKMLRQYFSMQNTQADISVFTNAEALMSGQRSYDLILMDLKLPGLNGMEAIKRLRGKNQTSQVIFITAWPEYALQGYEVDAVHYLLKPVSEDVLYRALDKALQRIEKNDCQTITVSKGSEMQILMLRDVLYCEAINHKIYIHLDNGSCDYFGTLDHLYKQLDDRFFRCHKSYIVNLTHVVSFQGDIAAVSGGGRVLVSRRKRQEFTRELLKFARRELL